MAETSYEYLMSRDTAKGVVDRAGLKNEVAFSSIATAIVSVEVRGDELDVHMADALSGPDKTALDALVAAHAGEAFRFEPLYQEEDYAAGRLTAATTYARRDADGQYSVPVEERTYTYQGNKLVSERVRKFDVYGNVVVDDTFNFSTVGNKVRKELA